MVLILLCTGVCVFYVCRVFFRRPWFFSRALGYGARRGAACTPRRKFESRAGSLARTLGVQSREISQVSTGLLSAELKPSKTMENPHTRTCQLFCSPVPCCKGQQDGNINRCKLYSLLEPRTLLCVRGHDVCVYALCVLRCTYARVYGSVYV